MNDPWEILGLDPRTATEADVKRAYAKLLRQHRPDKDPEGFRRIHEARDIAIDQLQWVRPQVVDESIPLVEDQSEQANAVPASIEFAPVRENQPPAKSPLEQAIDDCDWDRVEAELDRLADVPAAQWARNLSLVWEGGAPEIAEQRIDRAKLFEAVVAEELDLAWRWIEGLRFREEIDELRSFAQQLLAGRAQLDDAVVGSLFIELANALAIVHPDVAADLLDDAFQSAPNHWRLHETENLIVIGKSLNRLPADLRIAWDRHLRESDETTNLTPAKAKLLVNKTRNRLGVGWAGFDLLRSAGPSQLRREVEASAARAAELRKGSEKESSSNGCLIVFLIWFGIKALIFFTNSESEKKSNSYVHDLGPPESYFTGTDLKETEFRPGEEVLAENLIPLYVELKKRGCRDIGEIVNTLAPCEQDRAKAELLLAYATDPSTSPDEIDRLKAIANDSLEDANRIRVLRALLIRELPILGEDGELEYISGETP